MRRAEDAILAGTLTNYRRMVAVVAFASPVPAIDAAARVRLNAMMARTSQAALAVNMPDGRCAKTLFFRFAVVSLTGSVGRARVEDRVGVVPVR